VRESEKTRQQFLSTHVDVSTADHWYQQCSAYIDVLLPQSSFLLCTRIIVVETHRIIVVAEVVALAVVAAVKGQAINVVACTAVVASSGGVCSTLYQGNRPYCHSAYTRTSLASFALQAAAMETRSHYKLVVRLN
jgi:hypothetical protein